MGHCACAPKVRAPPLLPLNPVAGKRTQQLPSAPQLCRDAIHSELSHPHTHSPAPCRSSGSPEEAAVPQRAAAAFPATRLGGTSLRLVVERGGAGRTGLVHVTSSRRGGSGDKVRKRGAVTSTVLSESIPYIEPKIITQ